MNYTKNKLELEVTYETNEGEITSFNIFGYDYNEMELEAEKFLRQVKGNLLYAREIIQKRIRYI